MTTTSALRTSLLATFLAVWMGAAWPAQPEANGGLPQVELQVAGHTLTAEVASTPQSRETGLMFRRSLPANHGMVFVFPQPQRVCMWMKNTLIPLSVAFMAADGTVLNTAEMQAQTEDVHCAAGDASYALEMPLHWFSQHGVKPGAQVGGLPPAAGPDGR